MWNKVRFYWDTLLGSSGSTLMASSTASGYSVDNIYSMLETNMWKANSGSVPIYITLDLGSGLLTNGDFETGDTTGWAKADLNGAASTFAVLSDFPYEGSWYANVAITNPGTGAGSIQLYTDTSNKISVEAGQEYTVIFAARAAAARTITVQLLKGASPWTIYGLNQVVNLTTADQVFTYDFTATVTASDGRLYFMLGGDANGVGIDVVGIYPKNSCRADYLAILGHNLNFINAALTLQYSSNGSYTGDDNTVILNDAPGSDRVYLKEFTDPGPYRFWRLRISEATGGGTLSPVPFMAICIWGIKAELGYAAGSFDPDMQEIKANINISDAGYLQGVHRKYAERSMNLAFKNADASLYSKVKAWWEKSGLNNFFVGWETQEHPDEVYLMRPDPKFSAPLTHGGTRRDITINLKGRKEENV